MYNEIAPYYNELYANKDYRAECVFVEKILKYCHMDGKTILDVGCGTGTHGSILNQMGYAVHGVDISDEMIAVAKENHPNISFSTVDVRQPFSEPIFDAVVSMFGTMSYMVDQKDLYSALSNINGAMKDGGLLVFDGWNAYAVSRTVEPNGKLVKINNDLIKYTELLPHGRYAATFKFVLMDMIGQKVIEHEDRFGLLTKNMIKEALQNTGFELLYYWKLFSPGVEPTVNDWKVSVVARKVDNA